MKKKKEKVFVGMSGGVDSSVAALLLKERGYDVVGVFMRCWSGSIAAPRQRGEPRSSIYDGRDGCAEKDAEDARRVAEKLGIPFYVWDFEEEYKKRVVEYMVDGYRRGLTPNPDVMCNKEIKFGLFLEKALSMGADYIATGHYVRIRENSLFEAKDKNKDQSYFLWTLTQKQLARCLFPIGDYLKSEVREIARKAGLPTADKKDSQGICFLGRVRLDEFLGKYIKPRTGQVRLAQSDGGYEVVGEHRGAQFYTIGQRHIAMANRKGQAVNSQPVYVAEKNVETNTIVVAEGSDNPALYRKEVELCDANFINPSCFPIRANKRIRVMARVRYRQLLVPATLTYADETQTDAEKNPRKSAHSPCRSALLVFEQGQKFVAPGQSAVLYSKKGQMLGGGVIM